MGIWFAGSFKTRSRRQAISQLLPQVKLFQPLDTQGALGCAMDGNFVDR